MPSDTIAFWLKPFGFFDRNPSLDAPRTAKGCCGSEECTCGHGGGEAGGPQH